MDSGWSQPWREKALYGLRPYHSGLCSRKPSKQALGWLGEKVTWHPQVPTQQGYPSAQKVT